MKLHPPSPSLLLSQKADTHFTIPQRVEGWVDQTDSCNCQSVPSLSYWLWELIGRRANFFYEPSLPLKHISPAPRKTAMLTCKTALPDSPHPVIISKNLGFRALHLAGRNEFRFNKIFLFVFGSWLLHEKFSVCPKNNGFAQFKGLQLPSPPGPLARMPRVTFTIKSRSALTHLRKSDLATPICADGVVCLLLRGRGLRRSVQTRTRWPHPLWPERSVRSFSLDWIDLDRSAVDYERNNYH